MDAIERMIQRIEKLTTREYLPAIYDGFTEADALVEGEDAILRVLVSVILRCFYDKNLLTISEDKAQALENMLRLDHTGTLDERRAAIMSAINRRYVLNDAELAATIGHLAAGEEVKFSVDPQKLELHIWKDGGEEGGTFVVYDIAQAIKHIIPQNLLLSAEDHAENETGIRMTLANMCAIGVALEVSM